MTDGRVGDAAARLANCVLGMQMHKGVGLYCQSLARQVLNLDPAHGEVTMEHFALSIRREHRAGLIKALAKLELQERHDEMRGATVEKQHGT